MPLLGTVLILLGGLLTLADAIIFCYIIVDVLPLETDEKNGWEAKKLAKLYVYGIGIVSITMMVIGVYIL